MAKIVVLELGFEDDDDAEEFARKVKEEGIYLGGIVVGDIIECRVDDV
jgi:hypothetical protein